MKIRTCIRLSLLAAVLLAIRPASAQVTLTGTNYFQNFDAITANGGLPTGWSVREGNVSEAGLGNLAAFPSVGTNTWGESAGTFKNCASTIDNNGNNFVGTETATVQNAATNRCPAVRETAAFGDSTTTGLSFNFEIANTTGLGTFNLNLDFLLLSPQTRTSTWSVEYGFGSSPNSFNTIGSYVALATTSGGVFGATHKSLTFSNALDNQPGPVWIRIVNDTPTGGAGSRPTFGIDNFSLSYTAVVAVTNPVVIVSEPQNVTNSAGSTVSVSVGESGTSPINNAWFQVQNGVTNQVQDGLSASGDGSFFAGSTSPTLTITGALGAESGGYFVVASNAATPGTNSTTATITILDPAISVQPQNRTNLTGDLSEFDATTFGTQPLEYTWYHGTNPATVIYDNVTNYGGFSNSITIFVTNDVDTEGQYYLVASNQFGSVTSLVANAVIPVTPSTVITRWDFNDTGDYPPSAPLSSIGTGVGSEVNAGTLTNFLFANGVLADPNPVGNQAWEFEDGPPQGTLNKQAGFQFNTSTAGYQHIFLTWQERHSATASAYMRIQYSTNGTDFIDGDVLQESLVQYNYASSDLSTKPGVANNPNFAFRIVAEFESSAIGTTNTNYVATTSTSAYGPGTGGGTVRVDLMTVLGDPGVTASPIPLNILASGTNVVLSWSDNSFQLESATSALGPWSSPLSATSPYTNATTNVQQFFRLVK